MKLVHLGPGIAQIFKLISQQWFIRANELFKALNPVVYLLSLQHGVVFAEQVGDAAVAAQDTWAQAQRQRIDGALASLDGDFGKLLARAPR